MTLPRRCFDYRALGRLKSGVMNKTEQRYADYLEGLKHAGEILFWKFEGVKLRLADNTSLTMDFMVLQKNCQLELHDVKGGFITDDANVKMKVAADIYPFTFKVVQWKNKQWEIREI